MARQRKSSKSKSEPLVVDVSRYQSKYNPKHQKRPLTHRAMKLVEHPGKPVPRGGKKSKRRHRVATWVPA